MPIIPGPWLANPKKLKNKKRRKRNYGKLVILNRAKGGHRMARRKKRNRRRGARKHRRHNLTSTLYGNRRHRRTHRRRNRRKAYAKRHTYRRKNRRYGRRRRNAGTIARGASTFKGLFSGRTVSMAIGGLIGFGGVNVIEPFVPSFSSLGGVGLFIQKGAAIVGTVMAGKALLKAVGLPGAAKYVMYGAVINAALDIAKGQFPSIAAKAGLSGFSGVDDGGLMALPEPTLERITPYLTRQTLLS